MANIKGLVRDPEFQKLSTAEKKNALSSLDPEFKDLPDSDIDNFISGVSHDESSEGKLKSSPVAFDAGAIPLAGSGHEFSEGYKSGQQLLGDNLIGKGTGVVLGGARAAGTVFNPLSKLIGFVPKAVQSGAEAYNNEAGNSLRSLTGERPVESAIKIPNLDTGVPLIDIPVNTQGNIARAVTENPQILLAALGAKGQATALKNVVNEAGSKTLSAGLKAGEALMEGAKKPVEAVKTGLGRLRTNSQDLATFVTAAEKASNDFKQRLNDGGFDEAQSAIARVKKGSGAAGVDEARNTLNKEASDIFNPVVKSASPDSPLFDVDIIKSDADAILSKRITNPETRANILKSVGSRFIDNISPQNLVANVTELGNKLTTFWKSPDQAKYADRIQALEATRAVLSDRLRTVLEEKGVDSSVWSRYGSINEFADQIAKNYGNELTAYRSKRGEGLLGKKGVTSEDFFQKIPLIGTVRRGAGSIMERYSGGEPALLNKRIDQLFNKVKPSEAPAMRAQAEMTDIDKSVIKDILLKRAAQKLGKQNATPPEKAALDSSDILESLFNKKRLEDAIKASQTGENYL
jgi:hypothetical protein